jgi:hypothetical protein
MLNHQKSNCPSCEYIRANLHPLEIGAVVTVFNRRQGQLAQEGVATILRASSEPDTYFVRFGGRSDIKKRLIFHDYQRDPERWIAILRRHSG